MQTEKVRRGTVATTVQVVRNEGFMALYRGLSASLLRQITYSTVRFGAYDAFKVWFGETEKSEWPFSTLKKLSTF
jgi:dicarboxylate transporter 10